MEGCGSRKGPDLGAWSRSGKIKDEERARARGDGRSEGDGQGPEWRSNLYIYMYKVSICISKAKAGASFQSEILLKWDGDGLKSFYGSTYLSICSILFCSIPSILFYSILFYLSSSILYIYLTQWWRPPPAQWVDPLSLTLSAYNLPSTSSRSDYVRRIAICVTLLFVFWLGCFNHVDLVIVLFSSCYSHHWLYAPHNIEVWKTRGCDSTHLTNFGIVVLRYSCLRLFLVI
mgnify:CR=1 FL=1